MSRSRSGRPDTAATSVSEVTDSQHHYRPKALLCCGWGHISKPRKSGYKQFIKMLKTHFRLTVLEDGEQSLGACPVEDYSLLVIACPRRPLTPSDLACAHHFVTMGGALLVLAEAGGDLASGSKLNELLVPFSISVEHSTVLQAVPADDCMHPTLACIGADGVLNKQLAGALDSPRTPHQNNNRDIRSRPSTALPGPPSYRPSTAASLTPRPPGTPLQTGTPAKSGAAAKSGSAGGASFGIRLAYVKGATLGVEEPAVPVLASGQTCSPAQLPVGAVWAGEEGRGRVAVLGSSAAFDDTNIDTRCIAALLEWLLAWLLHKAHAETGFQSTAALAAMTNLGGMTLSPDTFALSERLRPGFPRQAELAADWTLLLDRTIYWPAAETV